MFSLFEENLRKYVQHVAILFFLRRGFKKCILKCDTERVFVIPPREHYLNGLTTSIGSHVRGFVSASTLAAVGCLSFV